MTELARELRDRGARPHNGALHRWFKACVDKVIEPLAARGAVRSVRTELG